MKDIAPDLLKAIQDDFKERVKTNAKVKNALKAMKSKNATFEDANSFAEAIGDALAESFKNNIKPELLPDKRMYYNIAERVVGESLKNNYNLVSEYSADVQTLLNKKANLGLKGIKAQYNADKAKGIINRISSEENFEDISWILEEPVTNFTQSIVDDTIKTNAEFQYKAGLKAKIIRKSTGHCCDWCEEVAGEYEYPDVPKDVYRRHRFCRCTVEYDPGNGRRQNVHTKKWRDIDRDEKIEIRKQFNANSFDRNYKQADEKIEQSLQAKSDKVWENKLLGSEQNAIYEYSGDYYGITNRYLRDDLLPDDDIELSQTPQRIKEMDRALSKNKLGDDLVLYRGVSEEEYNAWLNNEFLQSYKSTSISEKTFGHFGDGHRIIIHAPENTKGFYIGKHSAFKDEKEFLIHRGQQYKILSNKDGTLEVEIIG